MKKRTARIGAAFAAAVTAAGLCVMPASANEVRELYHQIEALLAQSDQRVYTPILPQTGEYISMCDFDQYWGVLVYCADTEGMEGTLCGEQTVTLLPYEQRRDAYPASTELMPLDPLPEFMARLNNDYAKYVLNMEASLSDLPAEYEGQEDHLFVTYVSLYGEPQTQWIRDLLDDGRFTVAGLINVHFRQLGRYEHYGRLSVFPQEGCTVDWEEIAEEFFGKGEKYSGMVSSEPMGFSLGDMPQAEAAEICRRLEEREDIASALLDAYFLDSGEYSAATEVQIVPILRTAPHYTPEDIMKQLAGIGVVQYDTPQRGGVYTPVRPAAGEVVNYWDWDHFRSILIYCEDGEALCGTEIGGMRIAEDETAQVRLGSFEAVMYALNHNAALGGEYEITAELPARYAAHPERVWTVNCDSADYGRFLAAAMADDRFDLIGILKTHAHMSAYFDGAAKTLYLDPAEGYTVHTVDWDAVSAQAGEPISVYYYDDGRYDVHYHSDLSQAEAAALCDRLEACVEIREAWLIGSYPVSAAEITYDSAVIEEFRHFGTGDLNGDGESGLTDAVRLARAAAGTFTLDAEARAEADLNADGTVDQADLTLMLRMLAGA
jgi:hypothetical protein